MDENGVVQEMILFQTLFNSMLLAYLFSALVPAIYYAVKDRNKNSVKAQIAKSMIIFGIITPLFYMLEILVIGDPNSDYLVEKFQSL